MGSPKCRSANASPVSVWTRGSGKGEMRIEHYVCACDQSFVSWTDPGTGRLKVMAGKGPKA